MDIFQEVLSGLGVEIEFDEENLFQCALSLDNEESAMYLSAYKDPEHFSLTLSVMTKNLINHSADNEFWYEFAEWAAGPLIGDVGICKVEGTENLSLYQTIYLMGEPQDKAMNTINNLVTAAEFWDEKLTKLNVNK